LSMGEQSWHACSPGLDAQRRVQPQIPCEMRWSVQNHCPIHASPTTKRAWRGVKAFKWANMGVDGYTDADRGCGHAAARRGVLRQSGRRPVAKIRCGPPLSQFQSLESCQMLRHARASRIKMLPRGTDQNVSAFARKHLASSSFLRFCCQFSRSSPRSVSCSARHNGRYHTRC
jgi:hypothetical protein